MPASFWPATSRPRAALLTATYRRFRQVGFDDAEAANLTAVGIGIPIGHQPWTVAQVTHLAFLHALAAHGAAWTGPEDRAATGLDDGWQLPGRPAPHPDRPDGRITLLTLLQAAAGQATTLDVVAPRLVVPRSAPPDLRREGG